jgi:hypothetical protein
MEAFCAFCGEELAPQARKPWGLDEFCCTVDSWRAILHLEEVISRSGDNFSCPSELRDFRPCDLRSVRVLDSLYLYASHSLAYYKHCLKHFSSTPFDESIDSLPLPAFLLNIFEAEKTTDTPRPVTEKSLRESLEKAKLADELFTCRSFGSPCRCTKHLYNLAKQQAAESKAAQEAKRAADRAAYNASRRSSSSGSSSSGVGIAVNAAGESYLAAYAASKQAIGI